MSVIYEIYFLFLYLERSVHERFTLWYLQSVLLLPLISTNSISTHLSHWLTNTHLWQQRQNHTKQLIYCFQISCFTTKQTTWKTVNGEISTLEVWRMINLFNRLDSKVKARNVSNKTKLHNNNHKKISSNRKTTVQIHSSRKDLLDSFVSFQWQYK